MITCLRRRLFWLLATPVGGALWSGGFLLFSIWGAVVTNESLWVSRAGAMVTLAGLMLTTRSLLRHGVEATIRLRRSVDGGDFQPTDSERREQIETAKDIHAERWGFWFLFFGTVCWAYGDLIFEEIRKIVF